jgi:hypothetical protein
VPLLWVVLLMIRPPFFLCGYKVVRGYKLHSDLSLRVDSSFILKHVGVLPFVAFLNVLLLLVHRERELALLLEAR